MKKQAFAMQKDVCSPSLASSVAFDTDNGHAYPYRHGSLIRRRCDVLLLPDAGVWVGTNEILPTHPANAGGFYFHPHAKRPGLGRTEFC